MWPFNSATKRKRQKEADAAASHAKKQNMQSPMADPGNVGGKRARPAKRAPASTPLANSQIKPLRTSPLSPEGLAERLAREAAEAAYRSGVQMTSPLASRPSKIAKLDRDVAKLQEEQRRRNSDVIEASNHMFEELAKMRADATSSILGKRRLVSSALTSSSSSATAPAAASAAATTAASVPTPATTVPAWTRTPALSLPNGAAAQAVSEQRTESRKTTGTLGASSSGASSSSLQQQVVRLPPPLPASPPPLLGDSWLSQQAKATPRTLLRGMAATARQPRDGYYSGAYAATAAREVALPPLPPEAVSKHNQRSLSSLSVLRSAANAAINSAYSKLALVDPGGAEALRRRLSEAPYPPRMAADVEEKQIAAEGVAQTAQEAERRHREAAELEEALGVESAAAIAEAAHVAAAAAAAEVAGPEEAPALAEADLVELLSDDGEEKAQENALGDLIADKAAVDGSEDLPTRVRNAFSEAQITRLHEAFASRPSDVENADEVVIEGFNGEMVTRRSLHTLKDGEWLNDEALNFYLRLLNARCRRRAAAGEQPRCAVLNSFFYTKLSQNFTGFDYSGVRRFLKKAQVNLFDDEQQMALDRLVVPVNMSQNHWTVAVVDFAQRELRYYDSLPPEELETAKVLENLASFVDAELAAKGGPQWNAANWSQQLVTWPQIPRQENAVDCGVFATMFARCLVSGDGIDFSQADVPLLRRRMVLELMNGENPAADSEDPWVTHGLEERASEGGEAAAAASAAAAGANGHLLGSDSSPAHGEDDAMVVNGGSGGADHDDNSDIDAVFDDYGATAAAEDAHSISPEPAAAATTTAAAPAPADVAAGATAAAAAAASGAAVRENGRFRTIGFRKGEHDIANDEEGGGSSEVGEEDEDEDEAQNGGESGVGGTSGQEADEESEPELLGDAGEEDELSDGWEQMGPGSSPEKTAAAAAAAAAASLNHKSSSSNGHGAAAHDGGSGEAYGSSGEASGDDGGGGGDRGSASGNEEGDLEEEWDKELDNGWDDMGEVEDGGEGEESAEEGVRGYSGGRGRPESPVEIEDDDDEEEEEGSEDAGGTVFLDDRKDRQRGSSSAGGDDEGGGENGDGGGSDDSVTND